MLTLYTKERLSRRDLEKIEENQTGPRKVLSLDSLSMLKSDELTFEDDYSGSDISNPFENRKNADNMKKDLKKLRKRLNRYEQNLELMSSFSDDFKKALEETRTNAELNTSFGYDSMEDIEKTLEKARGTSESLKNKLEKIFIDEEYLHCGPGINIVEREGDDYEDIDIRTKIDTSEKLIASPPGFSAFKHLQTNVANKTNMPWAVLDKARSKCETWLDKNTQKITKPKK